MNDKQKVELSDMFIVSFSADGAEPDYYGPFKTNDLALRYGQRMMATLEDDESGEWESIRLLAPFGVSA